MAEPKSCPYLSCIRLVTKRPPSAWAWLLSSFDLECSYSTQTGLFVFRGKDGEGCDGACEGHADQTRTVAMAKAMACRMMCSGSLLDPRLLVVDFGPETCLDPETEVQMWDWNNRICRKIEDMEIDCEFQPSVAPMMSMEDFAIHGEVDGCTDYMEYVVMRMYSSLIAASTFEYAAQDIFTLARLSGYLHRMYVDEYSKSLKSEEEESLPEAMTVEEEDGSPKIKSTPGPPPKRPRHLIESETEETDSEGDEESK